MPPVMPPMGNLTAGFAAEKTPINDPAHNAEVGNEKGDFDSDSQGGEVQEGIKKVEAMASVWTKRDIYIAYIGYANFSRGVTFPSDRLLTMSLCELIVSSWSSS